MYRDDQGSTMQIRRPRVGNDSGNAMVVALLVLMLFTAAGVTFIAVTKSEKQIAGNQASTSQAMYAAEAGLSEAIARMNYPDDPAYIGPANPSAGWGCYVVEANGASKLDPDLPAEQKDGLDNDGDGIVDNAGERYPEVNSAQLALKESLGYPYVRVRYKTQGNSLVLFGDADHNSLTPPTENLSMGAPVLEVTAQGTRGNANKLVEATAYRYPLIDVNSAVWAGASLKMNGNALLIDGHDHTATAPYDTVAGAPTLPGILTEGPTSDIDLSSGQQDNVLGLNDVGSVFQSPTTYDFNKIWATIAPLADKSLPGGTTLSSFDAPIGTIGDPKITVANGNLKISGSWTGTGILVVNGSLIMTGGAQFTGIVVALGDVSLAGGGPADVAHIVGGLIYQGTVVDASSYGGAARVYYSSEAVNAANLLSRYQMAWWHER
jgi:PilX N-terminal